MARGRMLQKSISQSKKLSNLSSDTARLLYTWMLAHLDYNGCFYGDPAIVNNLVFTRLGHPVSIIADALDELEKNNLIVRYEVDGEIYLAYPDFKEKQNKIDPLKEGKSTIPNVTPELLQSYSRVTPELLQSDSRVTPELLQSYSRVTPELLQSHSKVTPKSLQGYSKVTPSKDKIREDKIREANTEPIDNSIDEKKSAFLKNLKALLEKTSEKYNSIQDQDAIVNFVKCHIRTGHPDAILHCINQLLKSKDKIKKIQPYLDAAFKIENGKYNAKDSELRNEEHKRDDLTAFSAVLKKITQEGKL